MQSFKNEVLLQVALAACGCQDHLIIIIIIYNYLALEGLGVWNLELIIRLTYGFRVWWLETTA